MKGVLHETGKWSFQEGTIIGWIRCYLSFAVLRSNILCIRGSRSSRHRPKHKLNITLATSEGRVPSAV